MSPTKEQPRSERIAVAVTPSMYELLERYSNAKNQTISAAVGDFLEDAEALLRAGTKLAEATKERHRKLLEKGLKPKGAN